MRDYSKPLVIVLTGSGKSVEKHTESLLEDFIFGNAAEVDVKVIVPFNSTINPSLAAAIDILKGWGIDGKDFLPIVEPGYGNKAISSAQETMQVPEDGALEMAIKLLMEEKQLGKDIAFISIFDPEKDLEVIEEVKIHPWIPTLNLAEGLIDSFDGYESPEDKATRIKLQEEFAAKVEEESPAPAKKAATPRKRAAKKVMVQEDPPMTEADLKAPTAPSKPKPAAGLIADAVKREAEKKAARLAKEEGDTWTEVDSDGTVTAYQVFKGEVQSSGSLGNTLSGTIVVDNSELPKDLEPAKMVDPTPDVWQDVAAAVPSDAYIMVPREHLVKLSNGIRKVTEGFSEVFDAFNGILENK